ncbi:MAG: hypothetical protein RLZZ401_1627, partial [Pseudomonadota bacterium]
MTDAFDAQGEFAPAEDFYNDTLGASALADQSA